MSRSRARALHLACIIGFSAALLLAPRLALGQAQAGGAGKQAAAQALFEDAKKLYTKGDYAAACPKFADSQSLDPAPGTQFNLANCYEKNGQTASAWATFKSAAASYRAHNRPDWETKARERASVIEPKLSKLTVVVAEAAAVPGLEVRRDGQTLSASELGAPIPVDPGDHVIEAQAPGRKPSKATAKVAATPGEQKFQVAALEAEPKAPVVATTPPPATTTPTPTGAASDAPPSKSASGQKTAAFVALGLGGAGLVVGGVTGVMAMSKNKTANDACPNNGACASPAAVDANGSAKSLATISTIGFIVGGVGVAAGAILLATAPSSSPKSGALHLVPTAGPTGGGLAAFGTF